MTATMTGIAVLCSVKENKVYILITYTVHIALYQMTDKIPLYGFYYEVQNLLFILPTVNQ